MVCGAICYWRWPEITLNPGGSNNTPLAVGHSLFRNRRGHRGVEPGGCIPGGWQATRWRGSLPGSWALDLALIWVLEVYRTDCRSTGTSAHKTAPRWSAEMFALMARGRTPNGFRRRWRPNRTKRRVPKDAVPSSQKKARGPKLGLLNKLLKNQKKTTGFRLYRRNEHSIEMFAK